MGEGVPTLAGEGGYHLGRGGGGAGSVTALSTKQPAAVLRRVQEAFKLTAPFTAMGILRNNTRQTLERPGSHEARGFGNSAVKITAVDGCRAHVMMMDSWERVGKFRDAVRSICYFLYIMLLEKHIMYKKRVEKHLTSEVFLSLFQAGSFCPRRQRKSRILNYKVRESL